MMGRGRQRHSREGSTRGRKEGRGEGVAMQDINLEEIDRAPAETSAQKDDECVCWSFTSA
jgi:hypothetical protein